LITLFQIFNFPYNTPPCPSDFLFGNCPETFQQSARNGLRICIFIAVPSAVAFFLRIIIFAVLLVMVILTN